MQRKCGRGLFFAGGYDKVKEQIFLSECAPTWFFYAKNHDVILIGPEDT